MTTYVGEEAECIFCASGLRPDSFQTHVFDGRAFTCPSPSPERDSGEVKALAALPPAGMLWDELVKARNELFDLRIRCGCGPDQEGPDIWQRLNSVTDTLRKARDYISERGWHEAAAALPPDGMVAVPREFMKTVRHIIAEYKDEELARDMLAVLDRFFATSSPAKEERTNPARLWCDRHKTFYIREEGCAFCVKEVAEPSPSGEAVVHRIRVRREGTTEWGPWQFGPEPVCVDFGLEIEVEPLALSDHIPEQDEDRE